MYRPPSRGFFYGGFPRPQILKGASQPFSAWSPEKLVELSGMIPIFKLHGSLNWSIENGTLVMYQDVRPAHRRGGDAAIVPPVPEKSVPDWLTNVWREAEEYLRRAGTWVVCGYSLPNYDLRVRDLLRKGASQNCSRIFILDPQSDVLRHTWGEIAPQASITPLPELPQGITSLATEL